MGERENSKIQRIGQRMALAVRWIRLEIKMKKRADNNRNRMAERAASGYGFSIKSQLTYTQFIGNRHYKYLQIKARPALTPRGAHGLPCAWLMCV